MGIRTRGFEKVSQKSGDGGEGKSAKPKVSPPTTPIPETTTVVSEKKIVDNCEEKKQQNTEAPAVEQPAAVAAASRPNTRVTTNIRSPLKLRTPGAMARLGGMKVAARKLKKHRKRNLIVHSAAAKILRSSIKSNKTRRACRFEEKPRATVNVLPSRISTRTCVRRSSREGMPEAPLRTVELIKRPLELREPATKLLYMASLGLYPKTGDSDSTPIVVIRELNCSPGKKNGVRKSLELPLIPVSYHKRILDLANQDKKSISENIKPGGKQGKREVRKSSPPKDAEAEAKKVASDKKTPVSTVSSQNVSPVQKSTKGLNGNETVKANLQQQQPQQQQSKKKTPSPKTSYEAVKIPVPSPKPTSTLDLTNSVSKILSPVLQEAGKVSPNNKSLLKSNISPVSKSTKDIPRMSVPLNLTGNVPSRVEAAKPTTTESLLASACSVTQAMNLIMSNITILPTTSTTNRKRSANGGSDYKISECKNFTYLPVNAPSEGKPPKKKQRSNNGNKASRISLSASPIISPVTANNSLSSLYLQPPPQSQNHEEALNLCMKRTAEPTFSFVNLPPKLQMNTNIVNSQKANNINGSKPLNLIIPRPPPLTKAPLEVANFANCAQNMLPIMPVKAKVQPKKARKPRQNNNNKVNHSNVQVHDAMPALPPLPLLTNTDTDTTVHAKSLLKCMNGEENTCAREIGESLDSVKTMLSRLQTSIGPAVNGVRLITIE